jgi:plastocyanin
MTPSVLPTFTPTPVSLDPTDTIEFVNVGSSDWRVSVNGVSAGVEPTLLLQPDETYTFVVNAGLFHPLLISTDGSSANEYTDGVTPTGGSTSALTITLSSLTPSTLYYVCANHASMRGQLTVDAP